MKLHSMLLSVLCLFTAAMQAHAAPAQPRPMALLIMIDGMRADLLFDAEAPTLTRLLHGDWQPGYKTAYSLLARTIPDARPSSAANHAAIATGVTATKNHVTSNGKTASGDYDTWPTWLARVATAKPGARALFMYSWSENKDSGKHPLVKFIGGSDDKNAVTLAQLLAKDDAPDATMIFIDRVDGGGHGSGFYPHGNNYRRNLKLTDDAIGNFLAAIAARPTFAQEDWIIIVVADHGGYGRGHGMLGGQAETVPLIITGRHVASGRIPGMPSVCDAPATALDHFGLYTDSLHLDGVPRGAQALTADQRPLSDGLAVYLPFDGAVPVNAVANGPKPELFGKHAESGVNGGMFGNAFRMKPEIGGTADKPAQIPAGLRLNGSEKLTYANGREFTLACWVKMPKTQPGDPVIASNKNWHAGEKPGVALIAQRKSGSAKFPGVDVNYGRSQAPRKRADMGTFDIVEGQWVFYALSCSSEGAMTLFQGGPDGVLYWFTEHAEDAVVASSMPWFLGQDGTGRYPFTFTGELDDVALWTRGLDVETIRRIYMNGCKGQPLARMLK